MGDGERIPRMPQKPEVTLSPTASKPVTAPSSSLEAAPERLGAPQRDKQTPSQRIPRWLESAELFLRVLMQTYLGLAVFYAPWSGQMAANFPWVLEHLPWSRELWDQNPLFLHYPALGHWAANGAVRGLVSGVGALNLWFAFREAIRRRDG